MKDVNKKAATKALQGYEKNGGAKEKKRFNSFSRKNT